MTITLWPSVRAYFRGNIGMFAMFSVAAAPLTLEYLAGEKGVLTLAATALGAGWLIYRSRQRGSKPAVSMPLSS
jgi:hypothetical protein